MIDSFRESGEIFLDWKPSSTLNTDKIVQRQLQRSWEAVPDKNIEENTMISVLYIKTHSVFGAYNNFFRRIFYD